MTTGWKKYSLKTKKRKKKAGVIVHTFNPRTPKAEAEGFVISRPTWSTQWVPGQVLVPGLLAEALSQTNKQRGQEMKTKIYITETAKL